MSWYLYPSSPTCKLPNAPLPLVWGAALTSAALSAGQLGAASKQTHGRHWHTHTRLECHTAQGVAGPGTCGCAGLMWGVRGVAATWQDCMLLFAVDGCWNSIDSSVIYNGWQGGSCDPSAWWQTGSKPPVWGWIGGGGPVPWGSWTGCFDIDVRTALLVDLAGVQLVFKPFRLVCDEDRAAIVIAWVA